MSAPGLGLAWHVLSLSWAWPSMSALGLGLAWHVLSLKKVPGLGLAWHVCPGAGPGLACPFSKESPGAGPGLACLPRDWA